MTSLAERVLEAIEADEAFAGLAGAADDNWEWRRGVDKEHMPTDGSTYDGGISWHPGQPRVIYAYWEEDGEHIVRHQPSRVRRRCAADRKTIEQCAQILAVDGWEYDDAPDLARAVLANLAEAYGVPLEQEET